MLGAALFEMVLWTLEPWSLVARECEGQMRANPIVNWPVSFNVQHGLANSMCNMDWRVHD